MKNNQLKLDLLSAINPEILDRVDNMRTKYMFGNKKRRNNGWLPWVAMAACLCIVAGTLFAFLPSLLSTGKQVPIYQGMTVSSANPLANHGSTDVAAHTSPMALCSDLSAPRVIPLTDSKPTPPKPTPPHEKHTEPLTDGMTEADTQRPAPTIEASDQIAYYAKPNEDFYITVHVSNPDNYEILSFTLNGKVYSSYMFEQGSDMEHLILKCNVGDAEGIVEYTIDAIKYIDGEQIRDVRMDGDRTIIIGVSTEKQPAATLASQETGLNKLTLSGTLDDSLGLVNISQGEFYALLVNAKDNSLIEKQTLTLEDAFEVTFSGLATGTDYICRIMADYDALDGTGFNSYVLAELAVSTQAFVAFEDITIGKGEIEFNLAWDDNVQKENIISLVLYKGDTEERQLNITDIKVDGLLSHTTYTLVATYRNGEEIETVSHTFTTLQKTVPTLNITAGDATYSGLSFDVSFIDIDHVGSITKIELLHGEDEPIVAENTDVRLFEGLLSGNAYTVFITATYDLNDGLGVKTLTAQAEMKTIAYKTPVISIGTITGVATNSFQGSYKLTDPDSKVLSVEVLLFQGDTQIASNNTSPFTFDDLTVYTDYVIKAICTYDLLDGKGEQTLTAEKEITTAPILEIEELAITGSHFVALDGSAQFQATLKNPQNATVTSLVINGQAITNKDILHLKDQLHFTLVNNGQFGGGEMRFVIEEVTLTCGEKTFTVTPKPVESPALTLRMGTAKLQYFGLADKNFNPIHHEIVVGQEFLLMLKLDNPDGYEVNSIHSKTTSTTTTWSKIDSQTYVICLHNPNSQDHKDCPYVHRYRPLSGSYRFNLEKFTINIDGATKNIICDYTSPTYYFIDSTEDIHYISTPEDLMNATGNGYYELTQDIDLAGMDWQPVAFSGYLNGNGYAIKNMNIVRFVTLDNSYKPYYGLFSSVSGTIINLHMESASIALSISGGSTDSDIRGLGIGLIAGSHGAGSIMNCSVDANSSITVRASAQNNTGIFLVRVGGLVGSSSNSISNCVFDGNIDTSAYNTSSQFFLRVGGITCITYESSNSTTASAGISNCLNNGSIVSNVDNSNPWFRLEVGGISAELIKSNIISCANLTSDALYDELSSDSIIQNNYTLFNAQEGVKRCTIAQLNTKSFWTDVLGWDEDVWNLDDLDYENGKIPTLRREHK